MTNSENSSRQVTKRRTKDKKKSHNWAIKIVCIIAILYFGIAIIWSMHDNYTTTIALKGKVQEQIVAEGYVFREQYVINAPADGFFECTVADGERVQKNQNIGRIYSGEYDTESSQKVLELSERIERLESEIENSTYAGSSIMMEQRIAIAARDLSDLRGEHNISNLAKERENLNILIERKRSMNQSVNDDKDSILYSLKRQLSEIESGFEGTKTDIVTEKSGVYCSRIDGLEEKIGFEKVEGISVSYLEELDKFPLQHSSVVVQNEPLCKIVSNYGWYFAANIKKEDAETIQPGQSIRVRFSDLSDSIIYGTVRGISQEENGKVAITIYTDKYVEGIYGTSKVTAEIILVSSEGIKVPVESLHVKDGQTGVYVLRLDVARFVPVNVHYKNGDWAIISSAENVISEYKLQIYDEVVVESKNLEDGKVVR